ncbi:putative exportin-T [Blattamonas nauphoetae]|uniref:Exportin-T n=1 Tax=Blattamonas nauphoetae TaxID=2049346 RepID=A0ABQ9XX68_9EUKA|nr:putative exportin-T [Blattamonas nauphoetae]
MNATCLTTCFNLFCQSQTAEVRMWSIGRITELLQRYYSQLSEDDLSYIRTHLAAWIRQPQAQQETNFNKNKFAQCYATLVKMEYLNKWPTAFQELLAAVESGGEIEVHLFTEILKEVDLAIIHAAQSPTPQFANFIRLFKETMKTDCLEAIVVKWYNLLSVTYQNFPKVADSIMSVLIPYATWVDFDLIVSKPFLTLIYSILRPPNGLSPRVIEHVEPVPQELNGVSTGVFKVPIESPVKLIDAPLSVSALLAEAGELPPVLDEWYSAAAPLRTKIVLFLRTLIRRGSSPYAKLQLISSLDTIGLVSLFANVDFSQIKQAQPLSPSQFSSGFLPTFNPLDVGLGSEDPSPLEHALAQLLNETGVQIVESYSFMMSHGYTSLRSPFSTENKEEAIITDHTQLFPMIDSSLILLHEWAGHFAFWFDKDDVSIALILLPSFSDFLSVIKEATQNQQLIGFGYDISSSPSPPYTPSTSSLSQFNFSHPSRPLDYSSPNLAHLSPLVPHLLTILTSKMAFPPELSYSLSFAQLNPTPSMLASLSSRVDLSDAVLPTRIPNNDETDQVERMTTLFNNFRRELVKVYQAICRMDRPAIETHISLRMAQALELLAACTTLHGSHVSSSFALSRCDCFSAIPAIELALLLFLEASVIFTESDFANQNSYPSTAFSTLLTQPLSSFPSPLINCAYFDILSKYIRITLYQQTLIEPLYAILLSPTGIRHPSIFVSFRASTLLHRLTKLLMPTKRGPLMGGNRSESARTPQTGQIIASLAPGLLVALIPILEQTQINTQADMDKLKEVFMTCGILLAALDPATNDVASLFEQVVSLPMRILNTLHTPSTSPIDTNINPQQLTPTILLSFALNSLSSSCKELNFTETGRNTLRAPMLTVAHSVVNLVQSSTSSHLHRRAITFVRSIVDTLGPNIADILRSLVPSILAADHTDTDRFLLPTKLYRDVLGLLQYCAVKFKDDLFSCFVDIWPPIFNRIVSSFHEPVAVVRENMEMALTQQDVAKLDTDGHGFDPTHVRLQQPLSDVEREHNQLLAAFVESFQDMSEVGNLISFLLHPSLHDTLLPTFQTFTYALLLPDIPHRTTTVTLFTHLLNSPPFLNADGFLNLLTALIHPRLVLSLQRQPASQSDPSTRHLVMAVSTFHLRAVETVAGFGEYILSSFVAGLGLGEQDAQLVKKAGESRDVMMLAQFYMSLTSQ